ncbi:MAG: hypothetical protein SF069_13245 [Phycisphaerae bacterium]|nr:hypothetical protein [Phycisphaerae bacterium]
MPLVVGIDEAGYGPTLGPMVVAASIWGVPPNCATADFWALLSESVVRPGEGRSSLLPVGDSKEVFDRKRGIASLERSVLAFAKLGGTAHADIRALIDSLALPQGELRSVLPWYENLTRRLPLDPERSAFVGASERLAATLKSVGLSFVGLRAIVVPEDFFNQRVSVTHNKGAVVVEAVLRHIVAAVEQATQLDAHIYVDRLGGRAEYRRALQSALPDHRIQELLVSEDCSRYRLSGERNELTIEFVVDADKHHLCVALASMTAKYVREILMDEFNRYWSSRCASLRPTAGYYVDAQRFLKDIEPVLPTTGLAPQIFTRQR